MKAILSGNEAVARGCYESGLHIATAYPGTPSTEILENITQYPEIKAQWAPNEKVAFEVAMGACFEGARTLVAMKHVGLNVAADPFMSVSLIGAPGGLIVVTADDPGMHSSQNEQDNRTYAKFAGYPCFEPADSQESKDFIAEALRISIEYDVPVLYRMTTRICHSKGIVELGDRVDYPISGFQPDPKKFVVLPAHARVRRHWALERLHRLTEYAEITPLNTIETGSRPIGVITNGISYQYVCEIMPDVSILKLGVSYPLPMQKIQQFAQSVDQLFVIEELEPFIEDQILAAGIACQGKQFWPTTGEFTPDIVQIGFVKAGVLKETSAFVKPEEVIARPPIFCPGCPHRAVYVALNKLKATVSSDIGCYTLGALPPLSATDTCVEMGASIGVAVGMATARGSGKGIVATIGDSTFMHSGMTGLLNAVTQNAGITVVILDNSITAMTGGQHHPGTGKNLDGRSSKPVEFAKLCQSLGVDRIKVIDPYDLIQTQEVLKAEMETDTLSVVLTNRPCALYPPENRKKVLQVPFHVNTDVCIGCHACFRVSCPAISEADTKTKKGLTQSCIDPQLCTGCSVCAQVCPVQAIQRVNHE
ncbi:indolepyruvate ferredoxin oxidoreductase subunit alpha [candidate division KSB1 bacterium]|nr:indolepyruvate ferredoxin oxidoreductase subunit alpha [candidate division KSB1 bacterium]